MLARVLLGVVAAAVSACGSELAPLQTAEPGVVFTYPANGQLDVPLGTRIVVAFSEPVVASALDGARIVGPNGAVMATAEASSDGATVVFADGVLEPGTTYGVEIASAVAPSAANLPASGPLFQFTTRTARPRAAAPALVAVNGGDPAEPTSFRPMFESTTIRLVFSEPLDPRSVVLAPGTLELVDAATGAAVPATLVANGIHLSIDPHDDLAAGTSYELRVGNGLLDAGGYPVVPATVMLTPADSRGMLGPIRQVLRTRGADDPGPEVSRSGAERNVIVIDKPLIGREESAMLPSALAAELGDPKALGGPIAFTIRKGQRMRATGLDIRLGGDIPAGLSTGDILIELVTDGGGRIYRNPYQPAEQRPENPRAPLHVDLSLDVAVYAVDPQGNAALTQTVLGVQASGTAVATGGVLAIENVAAMELGLLGISQAPSNLVLELITDDAAAADVDTTPPAVIATSPSLGTATHPVDGGIEVIFDEPIDLDSARAGGLRLETSGGDVVASVIESHGAALVIRPVSRLASSTGYRVVFGNLTDVAGNALAATPALTFSTPLLPGTDTPLTVLAVHPGPPCALSNGRCAGGADNDDRYQPFTLPANEVIDVVFDKSLRASSITQGAACGTGSVRVEQLDATGACVAAVPGSLLRADRSLSFVPDAPWTEGARYRLVLVSGGDDNCGTGELCSANGDAASFDPLNGITGDDGGGPNLVVDFVGAPATRGTFMITHASPTTDVNGSGFLEAGETRRDENRAALRIAGTTGDVDSASFDEPDCIASTPEREACMYLTGAMPVTMHDAATSCPLPDGSTAPSCIPVTLSAQAMYATSVTMDADAGVSISTDTGRSVMRVREPAGGPLTGYIVDDGGRPALVAALDLYMDAPDMDIPFSDHDLHSKPLSVVLRGPVSFLPDGRIAIAASNTADVMVAVAIDAPFGVAGSVQMVVPAGEMKLQLVSPSSRGGSR